MPEVKRAESTTEVDCFINYIRVRVVFFRELQLHVEALISLELNAILLHYCSFAMVDLSFFINPASFGSDDHLLTTIKFQVLLDQFALG